ncbi:MAG: hypothetical protein BWY87_00807 [Deltaproteobacteria bacterium ADurb.Bin510]|nr:MAG: hypothetical protein BWY87_00807 [Deltaproteobacteria bacterium ADurb.Bin510]
MRLGLDQDRGVGAAGHQGLEEVAQGHAVLATGRELAVREEPGAALAVEHIALGVQAAARPEALDPGRTLGHGLAAFDQQRLKSGARQHESRHQAGRPSPHHQRPPGSAGASAREDRRCGLGIDGLELGGFRQSPITVELDHKVEDRLLAGIQRTPQHAEVGQRGWPEPQTGGRGCEQLSVGVVEAKIDFHQTVAHQDPFPDRPAGVKRFAGRHHLPQVERLINMEALFSKEAIWSSSLPQT